MSCSLLKAMTIQRKIFFLESDRRYFHGKLWLQFAWDWPQYAYFGIQIPLVYSNLRKVKLIWFSLILNDIWRTIYHSTPLYSHESFLFAEYYYVDTPVKRKETQMKIKLILKHRSLSTDQHILNFINEINQLTVTKDWVKVYLEKLWSKAITVFGAKKKAMKSFKILVNHVSFLGLPNLRGQDYMLVGGEGVGHQWETFRQYRLW